MSLLGPIGEVSNMERSPRRNFNQMYARFAEYFLPEAIQTDRDAANRARMFLVSHLFGPFLGSTVPLALYIFNPDPGLDVLVLALSIWAFWLFPFLLRAGIYYSWLVVISISNLHFAILWSCFFGGGITSPTAVWLLIIPILSIFYIGGDRSLAPHLITVSVIAFGAYFLAAYHLSFPVNDIPPSAQLSLGATSIIATLCYTMMMALYYARIFDASVDFEKEVRRRRQMASELRSAVVDANRASQAKSEFLARMSHELRTPLNAIIGYGEILKDDAEETGEKALHHDVERILDAGRYLVRLIDLILTLSRIEAGGLALHPVEIDPRILIEKAVDARRKIIEAAGNTIECDLSKAPHRVMVDRQQFAAVLDSILENAAQHTRDGTIHVQACEASLAGRDAISVKISDTGVGVPPEILPTIFDAFATAEHPAGGRYGETGLSLTVSSQICKEMGGEISVETACGQGSSFCITVPVIYRADALVT